MSNLSDFIPQVETYQTGDILTTSRALTAPLWLPCNGAAYLRSSYPLVEGLLLDGPNNGASFEDITPSGFSAAMYAICHINDASWIVGDTLGRVSITDDNGTTWSTPTAVVSGNILGIEVGKDNKLCLIERESGGTSFIFKASTNGGLSWQNVGNWGSSSLYDLATDGNGTWIGVGGWSSYAMTRSTNNATSFTPMAISGVSTAESIATDKNGVWILGAASGVLRRSTNNGTSWSAVTAAAGGTIKAIAADGNGVWVCGDSSGNLKRSIDNGLSFSPVTSGISIAITDIKTDGNGVWMAVAESNILRSSDNGQTWTPVTNPNTSSNAIYSIANNNGGTWIGVGNKVIKSLTDPVYFSTPVNSIKPPLKRYIYTGEEV